MCPERVWSNTLYNRFICYSRKGVFEQSLKRIMLIFIFWEWKELGYPCPWVPDLKMTDTRFGTFSFY
uniref:Uncharacterized protein n=1 Tax=Candidatus Kentrum sp. FW TaxID=2126338 RepID=A0A450T8C2_9GAMM|nr:MAG: hypothetical protein BECKFW1821A_GA0114235_11369 [Candidatus Kentron sp. FW]